MDFEKMRKFKPSEAHLGGVKFPKNLNFIDSSESTQVDSKHSAIDRSRRVDAIYTKHFWNRISSRGERGLQSYLGEIAEIQEFIRYPLKLEPVRILHFSSFFILHVDIHRVEPTPKSTQVDSKHSAIDRSRRVDAVYTHFF